MNLTSTALSTATVNRRSFLAGAGALATAGIMGLAGCAPTAPTHSDSTDNPLANTANDWLGNAPGITDEQCVDTIDCEVAVIGAGHAGYFAATGAAEAGAKVLLVEKGEERGFSIRGDIGAVGTAMQAEQDISIPKMEIVNDIVNHSGGYADARLWKRWADNSGETIDWYANFVAEHAPEELFYYEYNMPTEPSSEKNWPISHGTSFKYRIVNGIEQEIDLRMNEYIEAQGGRVAYGMALKELIKEGNRIIGFYAETTDGFVRINASKAVIVATGGYAANQEMYEALNPIQAGGLSGLEIDPNAMGDGIKALLWAGASMETGRGDCIFDRGVIPPSEAVEGAWMGSGYYWHFASQPFLKVNSAGERFCNEGVAYDQVFYAQSRAVDRAWYVVWDANWKTDVERFHTTGCSGLFDWPGANGDGGIGTEAEEADIEAMIEAGTVIKADTLEALAEGLGINAETFVTTCERYNELYAAGKDDDFGKDAFRLSQMSTPPYFGAKLGGLLLCTFDGIVTDTETRPLNENGEPMEGIYVVGNDGGGCFNGSYPNLAVGCAAGRSATFARMAGKSAAAL